VEQAQMVTVPKVPRVVPGRMILLTLLITLPFLGLLIMEQGRVIDSQRLLIQQLVGDSLELNNMRVRDLNNNRQAGQANKALPQTPAGPKSPLTQPGAAAKPQKRTDQKQTPAEPPPAPVKARDLSRLKAV
jgi:hypothetical protein